MVKDEVLQVIFDFEEMTGTYPSMNEVCDVLGEHKVDVINRLQLWRRLRAVRFVVRSYNQTTRLALTKIGRSYLEGYEDEDT